MTKSRTFVSVVLIAAVAAGGYYGWTRYHSGQQTAAAAGAKKAAPAVQVSIAPVQKADFPVYLTGLGTVQGFNTVLVRTRVDGQIDKVAFKEGQIVNAGRPAGRDRSPALSRRRSIRPRPRRPRTRPTSPTPISICSATPSSASSPPSSRPIPSAPPSRADGADRSRRCGDLQRPDPARLHPGQIADHGRRRPAPGRHRQHRQRLHPDRHRHDRPDRADRGDLHRARRAAALHQRGQAAGALKVIAITTDGKKPLAEGTLAVVNNQVDIDQRHHPPQGGVRQQGPRAVAGPVGLDPAAGQDAEGRHRGSRRRDPARHQRPLRLCGQRGQQGRTAQGQGQPVDRRTLGDRGRPDAGTTGDHGGPVQGFSRARWSATAVASSDPAQAKVKPE